MSCNGTAQLSPRRKVQGSIREGTNTAHTHVCLFTNGNRDGTGPRESAFLTNAYIFQQAMYCRQASSKHRQSHHKSPPSQIKTRRFQRSIAKESSLIIMSWPSTIEKA